MSDEPQRLPPVVIDLGKAKRKRVKELKRGGGPLLAEVDDVVDAVAEELGIDELEGVHLLPVVLVYERKEKKAKTILGRLERMM